MFHICNDLWECGHNVDDFVWSRYRVAIGSLSNIIMLYAKKGKEAADLPTIWMTEGRFMLDCGKNTWRRRWEEVYKFQVQHFDNPKGLRVSLDSLISAVYPALKDDPKARAQFAITFLWRLREERRRSAEASKEKRLSEDKNEGGTQ